MQGDSVALRVKEDSHVSGILGDLHLGLVDFAAYSFHAAQGIGSSLDIACLVNLVVCRETSTAFNVEDAGLLVSQLPTGCINILAATASHDSSDPVPFQVLDESIALISLAFAEV